MKTLLLILSLALFPSLIGCGIVKAYQLIKTKIIKAGSLTRESAFGCFTSYFTTGSVLLLAYSGVINALAVFTNMSIHRAGKLYVLGVLLMSAVAVLTIFFVRTNSKSNAATSTGNDSIIINKKLLVLSAIAIIIGLTQITLVAFANKLSYSGDQTLETVVSFISTDRIYSVDPLTGNPFINGYPIRLSLQCLPFLYSTVCNVFSLSPITVVGRIMPVFWLICSYLAIYRIADSLFKKESRKFIMLICFEFLLWCSNSALGSTGYNVFHAGFTSATVLELLLIYWTIGTALSRNYFAIIISVAAEPLVASTRFGIGACFFITLICFITTKIPYVKRLMAAFDLKEGGIDGKA